MQAALEKQKLKFEGYEKRIYPRPAVAYEIAAEGLG